MASLNKQPKRISFCPRPTRTNQYIHVIIQSELQRWAKFLRSTYIGLIGLTLGFAGLQLQAQDAGSNAGQLWKTAQSAFGSGNYAQAASSLEQIIKVSGISTIWTDHTVLPPEPPKRQWLEPVFFMLGAAYFDAKDWSTAVSVFNKYRQLFPSSPHLTQVIFSEAQANLWGGRPQDSIPQFTLLLPLPDYHVKAFLLLVEANFRAGKPDAAISLMETEKSRPNLNPSFVYKINVRLLPLYLDAGNLEKSMALLHEMDQDIADVADVPLLNGLAERLGDKFLAKNDLPSALTCYRQVRDNDQILTLQKQQIDRLHQARVANLATIVANLRDNPGNPLYSQSLQQENRDIDLEIAKDQDILKKYQTLPPVLPPLFLRVARAFSITGSFWESAVLYREILRRYPHCAEAESALYGSIIDFDHLTRIDRAEGLCQTYLTQYPKGRYADSVGFLRGALAYDARDYDKATEYFEDSLKNQPTNPRREQTEVILGDIQLQAGKFDDAIAAYQKYEKEYPQGRLLEKARYRSALALLFGGKADDAATAINAYIQEYPQGAMWPMASIDWT